MKIVCGACARKYSIADEKVQGKVFKIRCRNCSNVIVVKGNSQEGAAEAAPANGLGYGSEAAAAAPEWYVVIDGEQKGPLSPEDVEARFTAGQIQTDTYIWREGMSDWSHLSAVDIFAHLATGGGGGYEEDSTMLAESSMGGFGHEESTPDDATAVIDAQDWRAQQGLGNLSENDPTNAMSVDASFGVENMNAGSDGFSDYVPASATGFDDSGYGASNDYGAGGDYDAGNDYGAGQGGYAASGAYGEPAAQPAAYGAGSDYGNDYGASSDYGSGGLAMGAGVASLDGGGGDGMFSNFDMDAGNAGGMAYQSFSGIDSMGAVDLQSSPGSASDYGAGGYGSGDYGAQESGNAAASLSDGFSNANDMVGTRNENSVLFSLSSLQQVEAVNGASSQDVPLTEGSGLIDIQSLSSAHQQMNSGGMGGADFGGLGGAPSLAAPATDSFSPGTMSMPAIMPRGSHRDNKGLIIGVSIAVLALIGALVAVVVVMANREPEKPQVVVQKEVIREVARDDTADQARLLEAQNAAAEAQRKLAEQSAALAAKEDEKEEAEEDDKDSKKSGGSRKSTRKSTKSTPSKDSGSKSSDSSSSKASDTRKGTTSEMDAILGAIDNKGKKKPAESTSKGSGDSGASSSSSSLPKTISKPDVQNTIKKYNGRITQCSSANNSGGLKGTVWVSIKIRPDGRVGSAGITSSSAKFKGTDVGNCVTKVVRSIKFPKAQEELSISKYPFVLR